MRLDFQLSQHEQQNVITNCIWPGHTVCNICFPQDMSAYVKKIQFKLHESYGNPLRGEQILQSVQKLKTTNTLWDAMQIVFLQSLNFCFSGD